MKNFILDESENKTKSICGSFNAKNLNNLEKIKISNCGYESDTMVNYDYSSKPKAIISDNFKSRPELSFNKIDLNVQKNNEENFLNNNIDCIKQIISIVNDTNKTMDNQNMTRSSYKISLNSKKNIYATINYIYKKLLMNNYKISPDNLENYIRFCLNEKLLERSVTNDWIYRIGPNAVKKGLITERILKKKSKDEMINNDLKKEIVDLKEELFNLRRGHSLLKQKYEKLERQYEIINKKMVKFFK